MMLQIYKEKRNFGLKPCRAILATIMFIALVMSNLSLAENVNQLTFASPDEAVNALISTLKSEDVNALKAIFGPGSEDLITSGDPVADQSVRANFVKLYDEKNSLEETADRVVLIIGNYDWPFPIPIVKKDAVWFFDTEEGSEEILARRIGRNELNAIQVCLAYVDAQREYAQKDRDADGLYQYAEKIKSDKGKKNGLYWDVKEGEEQSPMGLLMASAQQEGYDVASKVPAPYYGYYYRILKGQGKNAPGGAFDYMVNGKMIGGFALLAVPAGYESSGIMSFIVNHTGVVYEKDLGPEPEKEGQAIELFDPDETWKKVEEQDRAVLDQ